MVRFEFPSYLSGSFFEYPAYIERPVCTGVLHMYIFQYIERPGLSGCHASLFSELFNIYLAARFRVPCILIYWAAWVVSRCPASFLCLILCLNRLCVFIPQLVLWVFYSAWYTQLNDCQFAFKKQPALALRKCCLSVLLRIAVFLHYFGPLNGGFILGGPLNLFWPALERPHFWTYLGRRLLERFLNDPLNGGPWTAINCDGAWLIVIPWSNALFIWLLRRPWLLRRSLDKNKFNMIPDFLSWISSPLCRSLFYDFRYFSFVCILSFRSV